MTEKVLMTGLEERLVKDTGKAEFNKVASELDGYLAQARKALDGGLSPQEFRNVDKYRAALEQARDVLPTIWAMSVKL